MKIHLINGHEYWETSKGRLNNTLVEIAKDYFTKRGDEVSISKVESDYNIDNERDKFINADIVLFYTPVFWMGFPGSFKSYLDRMLSNSRGRIYRSDGRDNGGEYGSAGLMKSSYALITTWNAPKNAFNRKDAFLFEGRSVDDVFFNFHSAMKFIGMRKLPSLSLHDVMKNADFEAIKATYEDYLLTI
jgi:modulator of drug activity B